MMLGCYSLIWKEIWASRIRLFFPYQLEKKLTLCWWGTDLFCFAFPTHAGNSNGDEIAPSWNSTTERICTLSIFGFANKFQLALTKTLIFSSIIIILVQVTTLWLKIAILHISDIWKNTTVTWKKGLKYCVTIVLLVVAFSDGENEWHIIQLKLILKIYMFLFIV